MIASLLLAASVSIVTPEMLNRAYSNDMATAAGRIRWHGRISETVATTETNSEGVVIAVLTTTYEDGYTYRSESKAISASDSVRQYHDRLARRLALQSRTNGVPVRLAKAIARRADEKDTTIVTNITVTVGNPLPPSKDSNK